MLADQLINWRALKPAIRENFNIRDALQSDLICS